ncbi:MAG: 30S ribosomal protein S6 [Candidatus Marinimicrobia bacterium]|nr:30S ribosomal protein S6 [Candidatus Neomarinimicrobiota bacterium]
MKQYEILFIVHPNYEDNRITKIVNNVKEKITNNGGSIINVDEMGKKKLAYKINNQRYGSYVLINFESEPQFIAEFKKWLKIQSQILAKLIVKLDNKDLKEDNKKGIKEEEEKTAVSDEIEKEEEVAEDKKSDDENIEEESTDQNKEA